MKPRENRVVNCPAKAIVFIIVFLFAAILCDHHLLQAKTSTEAVTADISIKNQPLNEVVKLIKEQSGYRVKLIDIDGSLLVKGEYRNAAVEKIFTHLLKGHNVAVAIDPIYKLISVISLGDKIKRVEEAGDSESIPPVSVTEDTGALGPIVTSEPPRKDPLTGLTLEEMQELHAQQVREIEQQLNEPDAVDPWSGLTRSALADMHRKQVQEADNSK